ncbi:MAG: MSCRAMM family protein, partial [Planctomycetota bacterium]
GLSAGRYALEVYAEGCLGGARAGIKVKEGEVVSGVDFELAESRPLKGRVLRKSDSAPIIGAEVVVNHVIKGPFGDLPFRASDVKAVTGPDGAFALVRLKEGALSITVTHPEYGKYSKSGIQIKAGETPAELEIKLAPGGRIRGTVRDADGGGVFGDYVVVQKTRDFTTRTTLETGKDGTYTTELLTPGQYQVIRVDGKDTSKVKVKMTKVKSGETATVDFGEPSGCRLHGKVTERGKAVNACNVSLIRISGRTEKEAEFGVSVTDEGGEYEIRGVQPGEYFLLVQTGQIEGSGRARTVRKRVVVSGEDRTLHTDLEFPSGAIAGVVRDGASGEVLHGATVVVMLADAPDVRSFEEILTYFGGQAHTDETGHFEVGGLKEGRYKITVVKEGFAAQVLEAGELGPGQLRRVTVSMGPESRVTGRILDPDGTPVPNAAVYLLDRDRKALDYTFGSIFSDEHGLYTVKGAPGGEYTLLVEARGFASAHSSPFRLHEADSAELNFTLHPESRIVVTVTSSGAPVRGALIRVFAASGAEVFERLNEKNLYTAGGSRETGIDGKHTVTRLSGGAYRLDVTTPGGKKASVNVVVDPESEKRVTVVLAG